MKSEAQLELEQQQRERNLRAFRLSMRERDGFCGDGVFGGRYYSNHGFRQRVDDLGPVAVADLNDLADLEEGEETDNEQV